MDEEDFPEDEEWDDWFNPFPMHVYAKVKNDRISGKPFGVEANKSQKSIAKFNSKRQMHCMLSDIFYIK